MAFQAKALFPYIEGVLNGITGIEHVQRGEPLDPPADRNAYILLGGQHPTRKYSNTYTRQGHYLVIFLFRVTGEEESTEDALADTVDEFQTAILNNQISGGLTTEVEINAAPADTPEYRRLYGPEFRVYPMELVVRQTDNLSV